MAKDLGHDSHLISPLIRLSLCRLDMMFAGAECISKNVDVARLVGIVLTASQANSRPIEDTKAPKASVVTTCF
jgi:hypothetical protein